MSSSQPRTKPWEVSQGKSAASTTEPLTSNIPPSSLSNSSTTATAQGQPQSQIQPPSVPELPTSLSSDLNTMAESSPYGGYGNSSMNRYGTTGGYGSSMYGGGYGSIMYGNSMYGGGYGSSMYGGGYGGYASGYGGYGSYGSGMYGGGMYGNNPSMMGQGGLGEGTQATFQLIESIIGAVGGFAQMLEATYMATHSSFFTMVNLAEQFGNLKNALGSILGIFALIKFVKKIFYKITGRVYNYGINASEFTKFEKNQKKLEENLRRNQSGQKPRISLKPLVLFLVAAVGFPYLLSKAIKLIEEKNQRPPPVPSKIQFARALYEFNPQNPQVEAPLEPKEIVAILDSRDNWLRIRKRSGTMGWVPSNYVEVIDT
ncbi:peroxin-13 [Candida albicans P87]|uniref:Peroxisomal membrane protein PEX13 n=1 Tax=Candida albicans (strain WO-1) TaxID=294748 RepID=C4YMS8_CANAW|nr:conserved hypothetical protein [Candida albicans WO-1]KGQ80635.1 peroxin-13 [Candida albicans GC75]KGU00508.1 peroxin-13 [Candida albicans P87]KGU17014.1 peroxin-13 [Candida albicans P34048]KGU20300.1 peroxin-13 [Candida albicans P57055]KGU20809.1 peroxin-13 [Candida albicans P75063]KHC27771.1 peroxin-13 [Candida albicans Ca6]KHC58957.1 peroxin-13 [Candida albicans P75016]KHC63228.1 peroxin-13 [Candida albicans P78042]